jgi:hypothetical protein
MICQECRREAPTKPVAFRAVLGCVILFRLFRSASPLCKTCIHHHFWRYTLFTALCGWWGFVASLLTPFFILANVRQYVVCCLTLKPVPPGAGPPRLTPEAKHLLRPFVNQIDSSLKNGTKAETLAYRLAPIAGVTPAQVMFFIWTTKRNRQLNINTGYVIEIH